jgi:hypothetical protein
VVLVLITGGSIRFLVVNGKPRARYSHGVEPDQMEGDIVAAL